MTELFRGLYVIQRALQGEHTHFNMLFTISLSQHKTLAHTHHWRIAAGSGLLWANPAPVWSPRAKLSSGTSGRTFNRESTRFMRHQAKKGQKILAVDMKTNTLWVYLKRIPWTDQHRFPMNSLIWDELNLPIMTDFKALLFVLPQGSKSTQIQTNANCSIS